MVLTKRSAASGDENGQRQVTTFGTCAVSSRKKCRVSGCRCQAGDVCCLRCLLCTISGLTNSLFCITSVLTLTAISVDRWLAIVFPMKYQAWLTVERARIVLVYIWLHALSMAVLPVLGWSRFVHDAFLLCSCVFLGLE